MEMQRRDIERTAYLVDQQRERTAQNEAKRLDKEAKIAEAKFREEKLLQE